VETLARKTWFAHEILVHERKLRGYLARLVHGVCDIEDVLQETYARLLTLDGTARSGVHNWHAFLFATARNVAFDRLRRKRIVSFDVIAELNYPTVVDERPTAYDELSAREEHAMLSAAIAALPERCRQVVTLRKLHGLSQKEVATRLGITESTVEKHVANGVRLCARHMFAEDRSEPDRKGDMVHSRASRGGRDER
jgi:RNA polymerase sigma factor (sigma-70 family)